MNLPSSLAAELRLLHYWRLAAATLLFIATTLSAGFQLPATATPKTSSIAGIAKIREAWVQDLRTKQLEPILKFYAPDAVFLQPNGERITGSVALRALFQNVMAAFNSDLTLHSQNLETSGDLAYDSGDFQETLTTIATGAKIHSKGGYIMILKWQPDGSWKIIQHAWTGTPPPGA
jgi:ketosteroid isomerase-like protein